MTIEHSADQAAGFEKTRQFFKTALLMGVPDQILAQTSHTTAREAFVRGLAITARYMETDETFRKIGSSLGVNRQRVGEIYDRTLTLLITASPEDLRRIFLQEDLVTRKPLSLRLRKEWSERQQGRTVEILGLLEEGKSVREIKLITGLPWRSIAQYRKRLGVWGTEVQLPYINHSIERNTAIRAVLGNPGSTDQQVQDALSQVKQTFYHREKNKDNPLLTPVSVVARLCGYHFARPQTTEFIAALEAENLPVGTITHQVQSGENKGVVQRYYFISSLHLPRAVEILSAAWQLQPFHKNPI